jgi:hypothetical protein
MLHSLRAHWQTPLLLLLLCWLLVASAYHGALNPDSGITGIDFDIYATAAGWLNAGEPLYYPGVEGKQGYMYTPLVAWALRPLAAMPREMALKIWFLCNATALIAAAALYARAARLRWRHAAAVGILLLAVFRFWPTTCNLGMGQVNCLLLTLVAGMMLADSRGKFWLVAVLIAAAAMVKLWMAVAGIHLLVRRKWGAAIGCAAAFCVMLAGSFALVGWQEWPGFIGTVTSKHASVQPGLVSQSFPGFARIRFADSGLVTPLLDNGLVQHGFVALGFLAVLGALAWLFLAGPPRSTYETRLRFAFTILSVLLLLPICHMEYYILAIPLLWTFFAPGEKARPYAVTLLLAIGAYIAFTRPVPVSGPGLEQYRDGFKSLKVSMPFFTAVVLWLTALWEIRRVRRLAERTAPARETAPGTAALPA